MTRETKPDLNEQQTPKEPNEGICEQDDSNLEQDQPIKTTNGLEPDDQRNKCVTIETEETKRHRRRHSAPLGTSIGRSAGPAFQSLQEEQRSPSVPCGLGIYSFFPNDHFWNRDFPASKSQEIYSLLFNGNKTNMEEFPRSASGMKSPKCPNPLSVGEEELSNSTHHSKWSKHFKLLIRINAIKVLFGLLAVLMLPLIYCCFDLSQTIAVTLLEANCNRRCTCETNNSLLYPHFEKVPLEILFDRKENLIQKSVNNVKNISIRYDSKLPVWANEFLHDFSLSAMYLTSTPIPTPSCSSHTDWVSSLSPTPRIDWASSQIHTPPFSTVPSRTHRQAMAVTPTPPLPEVPSILNGYPWNEAAGNPPSLINLENQCMSASESDDIPSCVHDAQQVVRHCTYCHVWSCSFCSRPNFISTMGIEHLMLNPAQIGKSSADTRRLPNVESSSGTKSSKHRRHIYSIDLNWWQRNMKHEFATELPVESPPPPYPSSVDENEASDCSLTSITARMTVADTKSSVSLDPAMEYLNNHYCYENPPVGNCLIHRDALLALREDIPTSRTLLNVDALRRLWESQTETETETETETHTQYLRFRGVINIRGDAVKDEKNNEVFHDIDFAEWEGESTVHPMNQGKKKKVRQSRSNTKSNFQSKITDSKAKGDGGQTHTSGAPTRTKKRTGSTHQTDPNRQTSTIQNLINPNSVETSSVCSGGARPKTSTQRKKSKKSMKNM